MIPKSTETVIHLPGETFSHSLLHRSGHIHLFLLTLVQEVIPNLSPPSLNFPELKSEFILASVPWCLHLFFFFLGGHTCIMQKFHVSGIKTAPQQGLCQILKLLSHMGTPLIFILLIILSCCQARAGHKVSHLHTDKRT